MKCKSIQSGNSTRKRVITTTSSDRSCPWRFHLRKKKNIADRSGGSKISQMVRQTIVEGQFSQKIASKLQNKCARVGEIGARVELRPTGPFLLCV